MIREIKSDDKIDFIKMCMDFYNTDGVDHSIPVSNMEKTFNLLMEGLDFAKAYVCEKNNKTVGYILLALTYSNEAGGMVVWLDEIYVKPEFRSQGIGSELIDFVIDKYKDNAARFRLEITESNMGAKKLYLSKGFTDLSYRQMNL
ncbi:GNAT family N-acetyltransferase [Porcipelethomonas sp.]|uniref:GNAT family N-acetyltransferase n=1 Tax=Porcipelethomonas sp. TaxID=2981675 RepID=UPI0030777B1B